MDLPLSGITVIEVGAFIAGPFATMQLADLGARVLKVEDPDGGDAVRSVGPFVEGESSPFARLNRNKESIALDLKSEAGRSAFHRLAARSDVIVENLRPGAMSKLGFGYDQVQSENPGIIYASVSGWGQDGPLSKLPGLDIMAQARGGLMSITGDPKGPPLKAGLPIADLVGGLYTALAVVAALRERDRTGEGQFIDISLMESIVSLAIWEAGEYFVNGNVGQRHGSAHQNLAPYQAIQTSDGHATIGAVTPKTWRSLCTTLGLDELISDPKFSDAFSRQSHRRELIDRIETVTSAWTTQKLINALEAAGVPCAPIADYGQVFEDSHLKHREFFWDASHPLMGSVRQMGSPMRLSKTPTRQGNAGPPLGAHTKAVLSEAGIDSVVENGSHSSDKAVLNQADAGTERDID